MLIDHIEALAAPYGMMGRIIAAPISVIFALIAIALFGDAVRRLSRGPGEGGWPQYVTGGAFAAIPAVGFAGGAFIAAKVALGALPVEWTMAYFFVFSLGGAVGAAELVSRYKDRPNRALKTWPAFFYMSVNALGSCAALYLFTVFREQLGWGKAGDPWETVTLVKVVLAAGFSALLFFRTSIFKLRVGEDDLSIGPSIVLDTLLAAADRAVDRVMAEPRAEFVHRMLAGVSFDKAAAILPAHCLALMQNVSSDEAQKIVGVVNSLRANTQMPDKIKSLNLGLALLTVVGEEVLATAVKFLEDDLQDSTVWLLQRVAKTMGPVSFDRARRVLPSYCIGLWPKPIDEKDQLNLTSQMTALGAIDDVPDQFKALILGIRLVRLTDGATLKKAVEDLGSSIAADGPQPKIPAAVVAQIATDKTAAVALKDEALVAAIQGAEPTAKDAGAAIGDAKASPKDAAATVNGAQAAPPDAAASKEGDAAKPDQVVSVDAGGAPAAPPAEPAGSDEDADASKSGDPKSTGPDGTPVPLKRIA